MNHKVFMSGIVRLKEHVYLPWDGRLSCQLFSRDPRTQYSLPGICVHYNQRTSQFGLWEQLCNYGLGSAVCILRCMIPFTEVNEKPEGIY